MTDEKFFELAREAGFKTSDIYYSNGKDSYKKVQAHGVNGFQVELRRFAVLVALEERKLWEAE